MTGAHQLKGQRRRKSGGRNRFGGERHIKRNLLRREVENGMDIAKAVVDQSARNQSERSCGLTARKGGNYQRSSKTERKFRHYVPADRVYYLQGENPFQ